MFPVPNNEPIDPFSGNILNLMLFRDHPNLIHHFPTTVNENMANVQTSEVGATVATLIVAP
jgi:hypothetical protein